MDILLFVSSCCDLAALARACSALSNLPNHARIKANYTGDLNKDEPATHFTPSVTRTAVVLHVLHAPCRTLLASITCLTPNVLTQTQMHPLHPSVQNSYKNPVSRQVCDSISVNGLGVGGGLLPIHPLLFRCQKQSKLLPSCLCPLCGLVVGAQISTGINREKFVRRPDQIEAIISVCTDAATSNREGI